MPSNTTHNFVGIFFDEDSEGETREGEIVKSILARGRFRVAHTQPDWKKKVSVSDVLDKYSDFHPGLRKVIRLAFIRSCHFHVVPWRLIMLLNQQGNRGHEMATSIPSPHSDLVQGTDGSRR